MKCHDIRKLVAVAVGVLVLWSFYGAQAAKKTYEIQPQIPESLFKSDTTKALEAYERIVDRALDLNGRKLDMMDLNIRAMSDQLNRVESKLDLLLTHGLSIEATADKSVSRTKENLEQGQKDPNTPDKERS